MRTWLLSLFIVCFVVVIGTIVFIRDDNPPERTPDSVTVSVESGKVKIENASQTQVLAVGNKITAHRNGDIDVTSPFETPVRITESSRPETGLSNQFIASLKILFKDTEKKPFQPEKAVLHLRAEHHTMQISEEGICTLDLMTHGQANVELTDTRIFTSELFEFELQEGTNESEIIVAKKATIPVVIRNKEGAPIPNADVKLKPESKQQEIQEADLSKRSSDESGFVRFDPVVSGYYRLFVNASPYLPHEERVYAVTEAKTHEVVLSTHSQFMVSVTDNKKKPVYSARVTLQSKPGSGNILLVKETSKSTGKTEFHDIPAGSYQLTAEHGWFQTGMKDVEITRDHHEVEIALQGKEYSISGRVIDEMSGEPIEGAEVIAFDQQKDNLIGILYNNKTNQFSVPPVVKAFTKADGSYTLSAMKGGAYTVGVAPLKNYIFTSFQKAIFPLENPVSNPIILLNDELNVTGVDFSLLRSWSVSGRVLNTDGSPLEGAEMMLHSRQGGMMGDIMAHTSEAVIETMSMLRPDSDELQERTVEIPGYQHFQYGFREPSISQPDGTYRYVSNANVFENDFQVFVNAEHPVYGKYASITSERKNGVEIHPRPGEEIQNVDIVFDAKTMVIGRVTNSGGQPIENAIVRFTKDINLFLIATRTESKPDGYYQIALEPGEYFAKAEDRKQEYVAKTLDSTVKVTADSSLVNVDFVLEAAKESFQGWIVEEDGTPVTEGEILMRCGQLLSMKKPDENGHFRFPITSEQPPKGTWIFFDFFSPSHELESYKTSEWGKQDIRIEVTLKERGFGTIGGTVMDTRGEPVTNYQIQLVPSKRDTYQMENPTGDQTLMFSFDLNLQPRSVSHPEGAFLYEHLPVRNAPYRFLIKSDYSPPTFSEPISLQKDEICTDVRITIEEKKFSVTGRLVNGEGIPYSLGFQVGLKQYFISDTIPIGEQLGITAPNEQGYFRLDEIPLRGGELVIKGFSPDNSPVEQIIPLAIGREGEERNLGEIILQPKIAPPNSSGLKQN